jgi:hypothetical protein
MSRLTIEKPDKGTFRFQFTSPALKKTRTDYIAANTSASGLSRMIKGYYNSVGVHPVVSKKTFDASGAETDDSKLVVKTVFEIKIDRLVEKETTAAIQVLKGSSKAHIKIERNVVKSGPPLKGKFKVQCYDDKGYFSETKPISLNTNAG